MMNYVEFLAGEDDLGRRFDRVVRKFFERSGKHSGLSEVYALVRKGLVKLNGKKAPASALMQSGDVISFADFLLAPHAKAAFFPASSGAVNPAAYPIIFENDFVTIIDKPRGVSSQDIRLAPTAASLSFTPAPLHRLDKQTTGLLVCSKNIVGAQVFSKMLQEKALKKYYVAVLQGVLPQNQEQDWSGTTIDDKTDGKKTRTFAKPLDYGTETRLRLPLTLAEICIETGVKHQIRKSASAAGFPLFGDTRYGGERFVATDEGKERVNIGDRTNIGDDRFFLHAQKIVFPQELAAVQQLKLPPEVNSPPPEDFTRFWSSAIRN
ncbi:MAG: RluA family pseudouridine synthase [Treponemataceae bacterium]|nr:MAG: RluA family pseudouridine synthase [Treponemataceae bacterium]